MRLLQITIAAILLLAALPEAGAWESLRNGPEGRASLAYDGPEELREWHYFYKTGRRYKPGLAVWASPALAVVAGRPMAFIGGYDQVMHALDLADKKAVWRKVTNGEIGSAPAVGKIDGLDVVFWGSNDRTVYAHVAFSGRPLWTKELVEATTTLGDVKVSSPLIHGGRLYICCFAYDRSIARNDQKGWLFCLDIRDGRELWRLGVSSGFLSSPVGFEVGNRYFIAVAARRGILQCFDITAGRPRRAWSFQMPHEVFGSPVVENGKDNPLLFLGSKYGNLIAVDARTGKEKWQRMAGNWIDNTACIGSVDGRNIVFVGSHDYCVYAFEARTGETLWKRALGGEVYSAPCFFESSDTPYVAVASLDNHVHLINARNGKIVTSFFTGTPIWDKLPKGEVLWGSPAVLEAGKNSIIVHGSFNDFVYAFPAFKDCTLTARARSSSSLWWSLLAVFLIFTGVILPIVISLPARDNGN